MRWLIAGPYPPDTAPGAAPTMAAAARLLRAGHHVDVVAPRLSAARHTVPVGGLSGSLRLARLARGYDAVRVRLEPGWLLTPGATGARLLADCTALAGALRAARTSVLDVGEPTALPAGGRAAELLLRAPHRIAVSSPGQRDELVARGVAPSRVVVEPPLSRARPSAPPGVGRAAAAEPAPPRRLPPPAPFALAPAASPADVQAAVRRRAATARREHRRPPPARVDAALPLRLLPPLSPPPRQASSPWRTLVRLAVSRLTWWQVAPVYERVNQLHQAAIEAADRASGR